MMFAIGNDLWWGGRSDKLDGGKVLLVCAATSLEQESAIGNCPQPVKLLRPIYFVQPSASSIN